MAPVSDLVRDLRHAMRSLSRSPGHPLVVVALGFAALGAYGVVAQVVSHGTREIGVRLALGASHSSVVGGVLREALSAAVVGALAPLDPLTLALAAAAGLAAWLPARRAASIDPALVLRQE
jgi:ABC-type antimicrobial peptide transport system permease subunit